METIVGTFSGFFASLLAGMTATGIIFFYIFCALIGLLITFFFRIYIAYRMAKNRRRDPLGWVLLSFFFSPLLTWIILLIVGDAEE